MKTRAAVAWEAGRALEMVDQYMNGAIKVDEFITHTMPLEDINTAFDLMHEGKSIRSVVHF